MSNSYGYNIQSVVKNQEDILKILNQLTTKMDRIEEANDRRSASLFDRIDCLENKLSELENKSSKNKISTSSPNMFFEFDEFHRKHFTKAIIESFYGPITRSVSDLIR